MSLSTLRRRIKGKNILFKLDSGKYFLLDEPERKESVVAESPKEKALAAPEQVTMISPNFVEASVLTSANRLVEELKAAYAKILQEKEEQIGILKEEVVDLKMLVNILESQVKKAEEKSSAPLINTETFFFPEIAD